MRLILALLLLTSVAACGGAPAGPAAVVSDDGGVAYRFEGGDRVPADRLAQLYCANLGRAAALRQLSPEGDKTVARYDCR